MRSYLPCICHSDASIPPCSGIAGSHIDGARIGPANDLAAGKGHVPWGVPPWNDEVDPTVTRIEGQPGQAIIFTERLVHTTVPGTGKGERRSLFFKYGRSTSNLPLLAIYETLSDADCL